MGQILLKLLLGLDLGLANSLMMGGRIFLTEEAMLVQVGIAAQQADQRLGLRSTSLGIEKVSKPL